MLRVHILTDDRVRKRGLIAEHGLSLWIEKDEKRILFDTGQSSVYCQNAKTMGIHLEKADYVILSHGHYDHCGGLIHFPKTQSNPKLFIHQDAFSKKYALVCCNEPYREIGIPWNTEQLDWPSSMIQYTRASQRIDEHIMLSGEIPALNEFEEVPRIFYLDSETEKVPDLLLDEQILIIEEEKGISVFLGCSHRGIINSLNYAKKLFPGKKVMLLVAGMHLDGAREERLRLTVQHLLEMDIQKVVPLHCTGLLAMCEMKKALGERCHLLCTGDSLEVG